MSLNKYHTTQNLYLLNPGHGIDTDGKCSVIQPSLFEFEFNRDIANRVHRLCSSTNYIQSHLLVTEINDIPLWERALRANVLAEKYSCIGFDIHANAGGGKGIEFYTSVGLTGSDPIADMAVKIFGNNLPEESQRGHKERNFYMLKNTKPRWILGETGFMDTSEGYGKLRSEEYRQMVAQSYFELIKWCESNIKLYA